MFAALAGLKLPVFTRLAQRVTECVPPCQLDLTDFNSERRVGCLVLLTKNWVESVS